VNWNVGLYQQTVFTRLGLTLAGPERVLDLGCGDGQLVISAVKDFKARRGVGVDIDADLVEEALDLRGCVEAPAKGRQLLRRQLSKGTGHSWGRGFPPAGRLWQNL